MKEVTFEGKICLIYSDFHYIARDSDGEVYSYRDKPVIDSKGENWYSHHWSYEFSYDEGIPEDAPDWRDSLVEYD